VWGVTRDDGSRRSVSAALKTAVNNFAGFTSARFVPLARETAAWPAWPNDPSALVPNWQVYQVAFDKHGNQRVTALWNGDGAPLRVRVRKNGSRARLVDRTGASQPLTDSQGWWVVDLPAATAYFKLNDQIKDPEGYHFIGGDPLLVVEDGVDSTAPVVAPGLGDPGSGVREFRASVSPADGQTIGRGGAADFFLSTRGYEGFNDPIGLSVVQWSSQRFPEPKDPGSLPLQVSLPGVVNPGDMATIHFETAGADPGIYFVTLQAGGGAINRTYDLALVLS
jgi:hypothetical protein